MISGDLWHNYPILEETLKWISYEVWLSMQKSSPSLLYGKKHILLNLQHYTVPSVLVVLMLLLDVKHINVLDVWILN